MQESSESSLGSTSSTKQMELLQNYRDLIIHRYEKRIRKTHRVADQTELKLKKQQRSLLHFKKELSRHVVKIQELCNSGDPHALKRLKSIRTKLLQLDKIVPYLGKYISVNRQAEMQTIAVLKESCTVEVQKLSQSVGKPMESKVGNSSLDHCDSAKPSLSPVLPSQIGESPYASLTEVKQEAVKLRSNYAELDFQKIRSSESLRPPSVKYSEVRIDSFGIGRIAKLHDITPGDDDSVECCSSQHDATLTPENMLNQDVLDNSACSPGIASSLFSQGDGMQQQIMSTSKHLPPVAKKPESPVHKLSDFNQEAVLSSDAPLVQTPAVEQTVISTDVVPPSGIPSIKDRIKVNNLIHT